jgi:hypothetical protein
LQGEPRPFVDDLSCAALPDLLLQALLASFRSLKAINQSVERCFITLLEDEARLVIKLQCRHGALNAMATGLPLHHQEPSLGIIKTHQLYFEDCETLSVSLPVCSKRFDG